MIYYSLHEVFKDQKRSHASSLSMQDIKFKLLIKTDFIGLLNDKVQKHILLVVLDN